MKLDIACGKNKKEGFIGIDIDRNSDVDIIATALYLPIKDCAIDEIVSFHFLEHLYPEEARRFFNEIFRVLKDGGKANLKVDRDWTKRRLLSKDSAHKHRYSEKEIQEMVSNFSAKKVNRQIYRFGRYKLRNKIFMELRK